MAHVSGKVSWQSGMAFEGQAGEYKLVMDAKAPLGRSSGMTPKEMAALGVAGCTAMDVVALLRKFKQTVDSFSVSVACPLTDGAHPLVFESVELVFDLHGHIDTQKALEAVELSQTKYCGVSAMISKVAPIHYKVQINGVEVGTGQANFYR